MILSDAHGAAGIYGIPYLLPDAVMDELGAERSHASVLAAACERIRADAAARGLARTVVLAHAFLTGAQPCESERDIRVGGIGDAPAAVLAGLQLPGSWPFARPAAGPGARQHHHGQVLRLAAGLLVLRAPGQVGHARRDRRRRPGDHRVAGHAGPRPLREVRGRLADLLARADGDLADLAGAWVKAVLTDSARPMAPMERLREKWPHTIALEFAPGGR